MARRRYRVGSWLLLAETALCLAFAVAIKRCVPFRLASRVLGHPVRSPGHHVVSEALRDDLRWAYGVFQRHWPWPPACLVEVLALALQLRRRGLRGTAFLGVANGATALEAHAWMDCDGELLPRRQNVSRYRVVGIFEPHP